MALDRSEATRRNRQGLNSCASRSAGAGPCCLVAIGEPYCLLRGLDRKPRTSAYLISDQDAYSAYNFNTRCMVQKSKCTCAEQKFGTLFSAMRERNDNPVTTQKIKYNSTTTKSRPMQFPMFSSISAPNPSIVFLCSCLIDRIHLPHSFQERISHLFLKELAQPIIPVHPLSSVGQTRE